MNQATVGTKRRMTEDGFCPFGSPVRELLPFQLRELSDTFANLFNSLLWNSKTQIPWSLSPSGMDLPSFETVARVPEPLHETRVIALEWL